MNQFTSHPLYRTYKIDSVITSMWEFYKSRFLVLFLTSLLMSLGNQLISVGINLGDLQNTVDPMELLQKYKGFILPFLEILGINLVFGLFMQYFVMYNPLEDHPNIFVSAYKSLKYLPSYIIILVLFTFMGAAAMALGIVVFIIGMFFAMLWLATIFLFILPVLMAEGTNIGRAINRIFTLSHKGFWSNLGWVTLLLLILLVISVVLSGLILIPFSGSIFKIFTNPSETVNAISFASNPVYIFLSSAASAIIAPLMPIFGAILYFNARAREDGAIILNNEEPPKVRVEDLYAKPYAEDHPDNPDRKEWVLQSYNRSFQTIKKL